MASVYDQFQDLYDLVPKGVAVELYYLPTERSRKWRKTSVMVKAYDSSLHEPMAQQLKTQESWYAVEWRQV